MSSTDYGMPCTYLFLFIVHLRQSQRFVGALIVPADIRTRRLLPIRVVPSPTRSWSSVLTIRLPTADVQVLEVILEAIVGALLQSVQIQELGLGVPRIGHGAVAVWRDIARGL